MLNRSTFAIKGAATLLAMLILSLVGWRSINYATCCNPDCDAWIFATAGWRITEGELPYRDFWDHKPPLIYLVNATAIAIGGPSMTSVRVAEKINAVVATLLIWILVYELVQNHVIAFVAALMFLLLNYHPRPFHGGNYCEEFGVPFILLGAFMSLRASKVSPGHWFLLLGGLATLVLATACFYKEQFLLSSLVWFGFLIAPRKGRCWWRHAAIFTAIGLIPLIVFIFWLASQGALSSWKGVVAYNFVYASLVGLNEPYPGARFVWNFFNVGYYVLDNLWFVTPFAILGLWSAFVPNQRGGFRPAAVVAVQFLAEFVATGLSGQGGECYYLLIIPSYVELTAIGANLVWESSRKLPSSARIAGAAGVFFIGIFVDYDHLTSWSNRIAQPFRHYEADARLVAVVNSYSGSGDKIWVPNPWRNNIYLEAKRPSPIRHYYVHSWFFVDTDERTSEQYGDALAKGIISSRPKLLVIDRIGYAILRKVRILEWMDDNYTVVAKLMCRGVDGKMERVVIFCHKKVGRDLMPTALK